MNAMDKLKLPVVGVLIAIFLVAAFASTTTVNQGDRGLVLRFSRLERELQPGLHLIIPFMESVEKISVRTHKVEIATDTYSRDIQAANVKLSVNYSLNPAGVAKIYTQYNVDFEKRVVLPQIMAKSKDVFGQYDAVKIVQSRNEMASAIVGELSKQLLPEGFVVESVQIESIDFSKDYEAAVEARMAAQVEVDKVKQNLERKKLEAEMVRQGAKGDADAKVMAATAEAQAIEMRGKAEAAAIKAKADALAQNPTLVRLIQAEKWDGRLPQTIIPSETLPIIGVQKDGLHGNN